MLSEAHPTGWANQAKSSGKGKYCQNFQNFQKIMNKSTVSAGTLAYQRSGKPMIDFKKTFNGCLDFIFKNNNMRKRQIADLEARGFDLKAMRKEMSRKEYEEFLEKEGVHPWLNGGVETTLEKLISFFMAEYQKGKVKINNQLRFTYSYFLQYYNGLHRSENNRICENTIKNHFRKINTALGSIFERKHRGTLCLPELNTVCVVLTLQPKVIQFQQNHHTEIASASEPRLPQSSKPKTKRVLEKMEDVIDTLSTFLDTNAGQRTGLTSFADAYSSFFGSR